ncbi:hypothetical protein KC335_g19502, partial [Hortaea werneckii]
MGNVGSRQDDGSPVYIRDQNRFSIAGVTITNNRGQTLLRVAPNAFPATRYGAQKEVGDETPVEYVQDPDSLAGGAPPSFLVRMSSGEDLNFQFTFNVRQQSAIAGGANNGPPSPVTLDTQIAGLTYVFASSQREVDNLVVREFHSDPNLHKNPNVEL